MMIIHGVEIKHLSTHSDERGFVREIIRATDPFFQDGFGQLTHSRLHQGVIKAWRIFPRTVAWWYVPVGAMKVALHDLRDDTPTRGMTTELLLGDIYEAQVLRIPAGVAYGCVALVGPTHLFAVHSTIYDPREEGRIPHDDDAIGYDWLLGPPIG